MRSLTKLIKPLLSVIIIGVLAWYIWDNWAEISAINPSHLWVLIATIPFILASLYATGTINELAIEPHGVKVTRAELFGLASITRFINQFAPAYAGASARGVYFKKKYNVSYTKFSSSFVVTNILQLIVSGILAVVLYAAVHDFQLDVSQLLLVSLIVVVLITTLIVPMGVASRILKSLYSRFAFKILERLSVFPTEFAKVRSHPGVLFRTVIWILIMMLASGSLLYFIYEAIGSPISFVSALFIGALGAWGLVLSITPGGLGVQEGVMALAASIIGVDVPTTVVAALLLRVIMTLATGLLALYYTPKLFGSFSIRK